METTNIIVGLSRTLEQFISGIDNVEKYIGKDFVFHDAEVDSENIDRDGTVKVRLWTWSDVDYELRFEVKGLIPEIIINIFDGVGLKFSCRKISVCVSESPEED